MQFISIVCSDFFADGVCGLGGSFCVGVPCSMPASVVGGFVVHAS